MKIPTHKAKKAFMKMTEFQIDAIMEAIDTITGTPAPAPQHAPAPASAAQQVCEFCDAQPHSRFPPTHANRQAAAAARILGKPDVFEAAKSGDIELVKDHVMADAGCVLKADSEYDYLFLALALPQPLPMQFGSIFLISVIMCGFTALMKSSMEGHLHVTRFLLESKANLEAKDNGYYTPYNMIFQIARSAAV
jgi:hypothetical protein